MNDNQLKEFKDKLEAERSSLLKEIETTEKPVDFGSDVDHGDEGTDRSEDEGNRLAVAGDLKLRVSEIDIALSKIQNGNYGICETCGNPIEHDILNIDPESRFCKADKVQK